MFLSSIQTLWLTPKASESWEGGGWRESGDKGNGDVADLWQSRVLRVDTDSVASGVSVTRAEPGRGLESEGILLGLHRVTASCICSCSHEALPSLAATPTAPSSQLLGFAQTLCLIPQALAGKGAVVTWSGCGEGGRRPSQVAAAWSFQLGWHRGEIAPVVSLWLPHAHVHTRELTHARTHIQCVTDGGSKKR